MELRNVRVLERLGGRDALRRVEVQQVDEQVDRVVRRGPETIAEARLGLFVSSRALCNSSRSLSTWATDARAAAARDAAARSAAALSFSALSAAALMAAARLRSLKTAGCSKSGGLSSCLLSSNPATTKRSCVTSPSGCFGTAISRFFTSSS